MEDPWIRERMLFGSEALEKLNQSRVAVFGLGGVGGYAAEALVRSGIGSIDLTDPDVYAPSNLNRQLHATRSTLGVPKTEAVKNRILDIRPDCIVTVHPVFFLPETASLFDFSAYDYVVDAVDTVTAKLALAKAAGDAGVPVISSMGTGNKTDPSALRVSPIEETSVCPLARIMRRECRRRGIHGLKAVWSAEEPLRPLFTPQEKPAADASRRDIPGSTAFVPAAAGLLMASVVVRDLISSFRR